MSLSEAYEVDHQVADEGVWFFYPGGIEVRLAFAGDENEAFAAAAERVLKPLRQKYRGRGIPGDEFNRAMAPVIAKHIVRDWKNVRWTREDDELPCNAKNVEQVFEKFPRFLNDVIRDASNIEAYHPTREEDSGNS